MPFSTKPFTQIFPFGTQRPISTFDPGLTGLAVSTRHPPTLVFDRLPQMGAGTSSTRSSTATKHLSRGCCRRSPPQLGLNKSGLKGGVSSLAVGTGCGVGAAAGADFPAVDAPALIS